MKPYVVFKPSPKVLEFEKKNAKIRIARKNTINELKIAPGELRKRILVSKLGSKALLERKNRPTPVNTNVM
jgi:hypothetical protein